MTEGVRSDNSVWKYSTNKYLDTLRMLFEFSYKQLGGFIFPKKIRTSWTSGYITNSMSDNLIGPYIEYGNAPKSFVKYRVIKENNAYYIDRYVDTADNNYRNNNISYQILYRNQEPHTYLIYGIDFEDHLSNIVNNG